MAEAYSLLEFLQQLSLDDGLRAAFTADPQATLSEHGLAGLTAEDVHDAAVLVEDTRTADFSLDHSLAPDPAAGFLDAFLPGEPAYLPSDLGESVDLTDLPPAMHAHSAAGATTHDDSVHGAAAHVGGFGAGHTAVHDAGEHLQATGFADGHHVAAFDGFGEQYAGLDEHADPDLDDLFAGHADQDAGGEHHHAIGTETPPH